MNTMSQSEVEFLGSADSQMLRLGRLLYSVTPVITYGRVVYLEGKCFQAGSPQRPEIGYYSG